MLLRIRQERIDRGWTQQYVADQVDITKTHVHDIETGKQYPSYKVLVKLLDLFGYSDPRELFKEASETSNLLDGL